MSGRCAAAAAAMSASAVGDGWGERLVDDDCRTGIPAPTSPCSRWRVRRGGQHDEVEVGRSREEVIEGESTSSASGYREDGQRSPIRIARRDEL